MIRVFRRFQRFVRPYRRILAAGSLLTILQIALSLFEPWPLAIVVDGVLQSDAKHPPGGLIQSLLRLAGSPRTLLVIAVGLLIAMITASAIADYWSTRLMEGTGQRIGKDIRTEVFNHLQQLSLRFHSRETVGDLTARVTGDVERVQDLMVNSLSILVPNGLMVLAMPVVMFVADPVFAVLVVAVSAPLAYSIWRSTHRMKAATRRARKFDGRIAAITTETLSALPVVQAFSLEKYTAGEFESAARESLDANLAAVRIQARLGPASDIFGVLARAAVLGVGAVRVLDGRTSLGVLLVFLAYLTKLYVPVKALSKLTFNVSRGVACAERIEAVLTQVPDVSDPPHPVPSVPVVGNIAFEQVWYSYGREPVLQGIDVQINAGEVVAIVGPTGAGKSTLASLVPRFFDPTLGVVRIDGIDVRDLTLAHLRSQISLVSQESILFRTSIWENIAMGRLGAADQEIAAAARLALVDEFLDRFPDGAQTIVGERGGDLSGGQRQRVAIARAILRNSPILILDEPTSALDASSEHLVVEALGNLMEGRTTIVIAHRLSTIRRADRILVLRHGRIVEQGTHDDLLLIDGLYAELTELQQGGGDWNRRSG